MKNRVSNFIALVKAGNTLMNIMILGLIFIALWLLYYAWLIIANPYQAEYREGSILLMTDFFTRGINPFLLKYQPLMNSNYGFLYNLVVLPFATMFGNSLAIHRFISILFIVASGIWIGMALIKNKVSMPFAFSGGILVAACLLFGVTPLARPDAFGEFLFLSSILFPWYFGFTRQSLMASVMFGIFAFLAKPYFLISLVIVAVYVYIFVSKTKGFWYSTASVLTFGIVLCIVNYLFECYFLGAILSNAGNTSLNRLHLWEQLTRFVIIFLPCLMITALGVARLLKKNIRTILLHFNKMATFDFSHPDAPIYLSPMNYFGFFLLWSSVVVILLLGRHLGAYMTYFFQLITPGLVLFALQDNDLLQDTRMITVPLVLLNILVVCSQVLVVNTLSPAEQKKWDDLNAYVNNSNNILNSPVLVAEMVQERKMPVDSGQSEYFFNIMPYDHIPLVPSYEELKAQGIGYLDGIGMAVSNQEYDYVFVTVELGTPFLNPKLLDEFYVPIQRLSIAMPQSGQQWTIEIRVPKGSD